MTFPGPLRRIGRKQLEQFGSWIPSMATYGGAGALGVLYFTDWQVVLKYVPFYGSKFDETN